MNDGRMKSSFLCLAIIVVVVSKIVAVPMPGQIIVDPDNKHMLALNQDKNGDGKKDPFYMCGHGGPEGLLHGSFVGGWSQDKIIDYVIKNGGNAIYLMAWGADFSGSPSDSKIEQWKKWLGKMDKNGIVTFFIMYDDGVKHKGDDAVRKIVNNFKHLKHLIWCVAEESHEANVPVSKVADVIKKADEYDHPVANHDRYFSGIDQHAYQVSSGSKDDVHKKAKSYFSKGKGKYSLNSAEDHYLDVAKANDDRLRKSIWALAGAGNHFMQLGSWEKKKSRKPPSEKTCKYMRLCHDFIMSIYDYNSMEPSDGIVKSGTAYAFGKQNHYILYLKKGGQVRVDLAQSSGDMNVAWYNPRTGETRDGGVETGGTEQVFTAPDNNDWVLEIGGEDNGAVVVQRMRAGHFNAGAFIARNELTVVLRNTGTYRVELANALGKTVMSLPSTASNAVRFPLHMLAGGTYVVRIVSPQKIAALKMIVPSAR